MKRLISSWLNRRMTLFCKLITDVFLILTNYFRKLKITADIKMPLTNSNPKVEDLNKIVEGNKDFIPNILAAHGLSGCNVTARYDSIAKETIVNQLKGGFELQNSYNIGIDAPTVLLKSSELVHVMILSLTIYATAELSLGNEGSLSKERLSATEIVTTKQRIFQRKCATNSLPVCCIVCSYEPQSSYFRP